MISKLWLECSEGVPWWNPIFHHTASSLWKLRAKKKKKKVLSERRIMYSKTLNQSLLSGNKLLPQTRLQQWSWLFTILSSEEPQLRLGADQISALLTRETYHQTWWMWKGLLTQLKTRLLPKCAAPLGLTELRRLLQLIILVPWR